MRRLLSIGLLLLLTCCELILNPDDVVCVGPCGVAPAAPAAPTGVTATAGDTAVTVSWTPSLTAGVTYAVYRSVDSSLPRSGWSRTSPAANGVVIGALANGTTYHFFVTATLGGIESAASTPTVSATPMAIPSVPLPPANVTVSSGDRSITVAWTASSGATSYNAYYSTTGPVVRATATKVTGLNSGSLLSGLTNGVLHRLVITAVNAAGESSNSMEVSATPAVLGRMVVVMGYDAAQVPIASSEIYDPVNDRWTPAANPIPIPPGQPANLEAANAAAFGDGRVMVAGGHASVAGAQLGLNQASIWDPTINSWSTVTPMNFGRGSFILAPLADGSMLAATGCSGGCSGNNVLGQTLAQVSTSAELFDGTSWRTVAQLTTGRAGAIYSLVLKDGRVLVCGGTDGFSTTWNSCELFTPDPAAAGGAGAWSVAGAPTLPDPGARQMVLVGTKVLFLDQAGTSSYLWDPAAGAGLTASALATSQRAGLLAPLSDGRVMLIGGSVGGMAASAAVTTVQVWDPANNSWTQAASLGTSRTLPAVTVLGDGRVVVAGGGTGTNWSTSLTATVEIWSPVTQAWTAAASMGTARNRAYGFRIP
jgi:hypothetical protein